MIVVLERFENVMTYEEITKKTLPVRTDIFCAIIRPPNTAKPVQNE